MLAGPFLPLNPDIIVPSSVDIYPGLSGPLLVPPHVWNNYALDIPDDATLHYIYDVGRRDAAYWAAQHLQQQVKPVQILEALHATIVAT